MTCVRGTQCTQDTQCAANEHCTNGRCEPNTSCTTNADCPADQYCDTTTMSCTRAPGCQTMNDCPAGLACVNNRCQQFTGMGTLTCPPPPANVRILDPLMLTAMLNNVVPGTYTFRWSVQSLIDSAGNDIPNTLALNGADTLTVRFTPVVPGAYTLKATLTQLNTQDVSCTVAFPVDGPTANFNAQLIMNDAVDVDIHVLHPEGRAMGGRPAVNNEANWFFNFNWGPTDSATCHITNPLDGYVNCATMEEKRVLPDCNFTNCTTCTVRVPDQPSCTSKILAWNHEQAGTVAHPNGTSPTYTYAFAPPGMTLSADVNPRLDIDNRRGCYTDGLGTRVCTPENISIPQPRAGTYTVAVHYYGKPYLPGVPTSNQRGEPAGAKTSVVVELFCRGPATDPQGGFHRFNCTDIGVDDWCFVTDVEWGPSGCQSFSAATRTFTTTH
jgi:hypothetical protein